MRPARREVLVPTTRAGAAPPRDPRAGGVATASARLRAALLAPPDWLVAAGDAGRVAAGLADARPGVPVVGCELLDLRARGPVWKVRYRLALDGGPGHRADVVLTGEARPPHHAAGSPRATGATGTARWRVALPALGLDLRTEVSDRRLPAAALLLDPTTARDLLERGLAAAYPGVRLAGCIPTAVRYVYGARCTVVYRLVGAADHGLPAAVVAKAHADGEGERVDAAMRAWWATSLARGDVARIARPLGYLADPGVLLQEALPGDRTLREVLAGVAAGDDPAPAADLLRGAAGALVAMHGSGAAGAAGATPRTWDDDLDHARRTVARLRPTWAAAADALDPLLDSLAARAGPTAPTRACPSHGAFRPSQVLVDGARIGILDLDGTCLAEPERDVGRFTTSVAKAMLRAPAATPAARDRSRALGRELTGAFAARYAAGAPLDLGRLALWQALDVVAGLAHTAATLRPGAERLLRMLDDVPPGVLDRSGSVPA